ncbi:hypothetical protein [Olsenella intestinalis]|uniref:hypothetical protein n=1 Tax=Olsenella intestinalis TaxID=2930083 RepID=UPI00200EB0BD|nr:hypothetical protein [Olsenella intestinalis]
MKTQKRTHGIWMPAPKKRTASTGDDSDHGNKKQQKAKQKTKQKSKQKASQGTTKNSERKRNAQLARAQKAKQRSAWMRHLRELHELCKDDKPAPTMLGGMKSSGIKTKSTYTHTPIEDEKPEDQRHAIWQPPQTDKSRFSGTSSSRHKATASYKVGADYETIAYDDEYKDSKPTQKEKKKRKGKQNKKKRKAKGQGGLATQSSPKASGSKKQKRPITTGPLSAKEKRTFDNNYRIRGGNPSWRGWDNMIIPGRTRQFLYSQVHALGLDKPDDKKWTKGEKAVFRDHRHKLLASSPQWKTLLPRKSERAIKRAYADRLA